MPEVKKRRPRPSSENSIQLFMHCRRCLQERPEGESPQTWARLSVGWTDIGIQVWCNRHEINIVHVDFEGEVHPANQGGSPAKQ